MNMLTIYLTHHIRTEMEDKNIQKCLKTPINTNQASPII